MQGACKTAGATERNAPVGLEREKTGEKATVSEKTKASSRVGDSFLQWGTTSTCHSKNAVSETQSTRAQHSCKSEETVII